MLVNCLPHQTNENIGSYFMNVWIQDADQVDFTDFSLSNVYRTKCVDNFYIVIRYLE